MPWWRGSMTAPKTTDAATSPAAVSISSTTSLPRWAARLLLAAGSLLLFLLMLVPVGYYALKSPLLYDKLAPLLATRLQPLGIELEQPGSLQLDLLRGLTLQNLHLRWHDEQQGNVELAVGRLHVEYAVAPLLRGRLDITDAQLSNVQLTTNLLATNESEAATASPMTLTELDELLRSPPIPLTIDRLSLANIRFDLRLDQDEPHWTRLQGHIQQLSGTANWQHDRLQGQLHLAIDKPSGGAWKLIQAGPTGRQQLTLTPDLNSQLAWNLTRDQQGWTLNKATIDSRLAVDHPSLMQQDKTLGHSTALTLNINASASSAPNTAHQTGIASVFPLQVDATVDSDITALTLDDFRHDGLRLDLLASHQLAITLHGELAPFSDSPPPLAFSGKQTLSLMRLDARHQDQQANISNLTLTLDAKGNAATSLPIATPLSFDIDLASQADKIHLSQTSVESTFSPQIKLAANGRLDSANWQQDLTLHFTPELVTSDLSVRIGEGDQAEQYHVDQQQLTASGDFQHGSLTLRSELALDDAHIPQLKRKLSVAGQVDLTTDLELSQPTASLQVQLDNKALASLKLSADNRRSPFTLHHELEATLDARLRRLHAAADPLETLGDLKLHWRGDLDLRHDADNLLTADFSRLAQWPLHQQGEIRIQQRRRPQQADGLVLTKPAKLTYALAKAGNDYQSTLHLTAAGLRAASMTRPIPLQFWHKAKFDWPLTTADSSATLRIDDTDAISLQLNAKNKPRHLALDSRWSLNVRPQWESWLPALAPVEMVGALKSAHWLKAEISHPYRSILDATPAALNKMRATLTLDSQLTQATNQPGTLLQLSGPTILKQHLDWSAGASQLKSRFEISAAELSQQVQIKGLNGSIELSTASSLAPQDGKLALQLSSGSLTLLSEGDDQSAAANLEAVIVPLDLKLSARQQNEKIILDSLHLRSGAGFIDLAATGEASLDGNNAQLDGTLTTTLRHDLLINPYFGGTGSATVPWHLVLLDGRQLSIDGETRFDSLDITTKHFQLQGLDGRMNIAEELIWTGEQLKFRYLKNPDPFQRVDFTRVQPFLEDRDNLRADVISLDGKAFGPALASIDIKQNVVHLQQLDVDLFGGHLTGQLYLDARPGAWKIGLLSRITQLDPRQLLPQGRKSKADILAPLNMRTAVEFDIGQRLLQGRIDITKISREQLFQLLEIIDPDYQNEQLAPLRSALRLAFPQRLSIDMRQGLLDMEVAISALGQPLRIRGLPLTPLIQHFAGVALEQLGSIPLE